MLPMPCVSGREGRAPRRHVQRRKASQRPQAMRLLGLSFVRFGLVGISNTVVGFVVIYLCLRVLSFGDLAANATGYAVGFLWSFGLNRAWTFRHRGAPVRSMPRFALVCAAAY